MKKLVISLLACSSLNAFAQSATPQDCSEEILAGSWRHAHTNLLSPAESILSIDLKASKNPLEHNFKQYRNETGKLFFVYKSLYSTAQLDAKNCVISAHLNETQSLNINEDGSIDGSSDYNEANQDQLIKIEILTPKKIEVKNCGTDTSCTNIMSEIYEKQGQ